MKEPLVTIKEDGTVREDFRVIIGFDELGLPTLIKEEEDDEYPEWVYGFIRKWRYDFYMNSPRWKEKRQQAIDGAKGRCQICNSDRFLHVHHRTYERFGDEDLDDLTVLCGRCHTRCHKQYYDD